MSSRKFSFNYICTKKSSTFKCSIKKIRFWHHKEGKIILLLVILRFRKKVALSDPLFHVNTVNLLVFILLCLINNLTYSYTCSYFRCNMIWLFEIHKSIKWYVEWVIVTRILFYLALYLLVCLLREAYKILTAEVLGRPSDEISSLLSQKGFVIENHYKWWILCISLLCIPYKLFFFFSTEDC